MVRNGISFIYGNITYLAYKFKNDPFKIIGPLNKFIHKCNKFEIVVRTLKLAFTDLFYFTYTRFVGHFRARHKKWHYTLVEALWRPLVP